jgi:hypothetical protein
MVGHALPDADQKAPVSIKAVDVLLLASRAWLALRYARRHGSA